MDIIEDHEEAKEILALPIETKSQSRVTALEYSHLDWTYVGGLNMIKKGEWIYSLDNPSKITMNNEELDNRKWPTNLELEAIE